MEPSFWSGFRICQKKSWRHFWKIRSEKCVKEERQQTSWNLVKQSDDALIEIIDLHVGDSHFAIQNIFSPASYPGLFCDSLWAIIWGCKVMRPNTSRYGAKIPRRKPLHTNTNDIRSLCETVDFHKYSVSIHHSRRHLRYYFDSGQELAPTLNSMTLCAREKSSNSYTGIRANHSRARWSTLDSKMHAFRTGTNICSPILQTCLT